MTAELIEAARERSGLSQAALAEAAGTSRTTLNAYERGRKSPTASTLSRILQATGHRLTISRPVEFRTVSGARGSQHHVADHLWRLPAREAFRTVTLPRRLDWSTTEPRSFDLRDRHQRTRCYEIVLREGEPDDIRSIVDGCLLVDAWSDLFLPSMLYDAWAALIESELQ